MIGRFDAARELLDQACKALEDLGFVTLNSSFTQYDGLVELLAGDLAREEVSLLTARLARCIVALDLEIAALD